MAPTQTEGPKGGQPYPGLGNARQPYPTQPGRDQWRYRRRFMIAIVGFCMACIMYVLGTEADTETARTAVSMAFTILGSSLAAYTFSAAWENVGGAKK